MIPVCGRASKEVRPRRCPGNAPLVGETLPVSNYVETNVLRRDGSAYSAEA
jgi:hypothetical protein